MSTFVLVHGAWSGAHGFRHLRRGLQAAGHEVFTPSLTGLGERVHLLSPQVNLGTHVRDVVNQVLYEDLRDIVLVGFSYGGFVVTGTLAHIAERVRHLVYLDAFVPQDGQSVYSHLGAPAQRAITIGEDWVTQPAPRAFDDAAEGEWVTLRRTPHPRACFTEPVYLPKPLEDYAFSRSYIKATVVAEGEPGAEAFWRAARHAQSLPDQWRYVEIAGNHMLASNRPAETVAALRAIAEHG
ncbi:alpha/beta fold hydrolase [Aquabacterium sp.]|uniref:alpha/beta fold hydrolase n=1 Tax=Aquabacterium sp. TaxID=1872578 RepID=UPI003783B9C1